MDHRTGFITHETAYAITNATATQLAPAAAAQAIRNHWQVENGLHRQKDVRMKEDNDQTRTRHAPHNLAALRNLAITVLHQATAKATPAKRWAVARLQSWRIHKAMGLAMK